MIDQPGEKRVDEDDGRQTAAKPRRNQGMRSPILSRN